MGKKRNKVEIFKLEDRVLFEAGAVVQAAEAAAADQANNDAAGDGSAAAEMQSDNSQTASDELTPDNLAEMPVPPEMSGSDNADDTADADAADFAAADPETETVAFTDAPIAASETSERILVVLNSSVADADSIVNDLGDNVEVLRLEAGTDALDTINDYLDEHADTKYSAIHLVSHGSEGYITLNGEKIDSTTINPADWKAIGEHLTDDADILVYGCDTAKSEEGKALVQTIANLTGADVAASIDSTGANGNWDLEYRSGLIEAATFVPESYRYDLAATTITVNTLRDVVDAADGVTSLREAINEANTNGGEYTIIFDPNLVKNADTDGNDAYVIKLDVSLGALTISQEGLNISIDGTIGTDRVIIDGGNTYTITTPDDSTAEPNTKSGTQIFNITNSTAQLRDLQLINGYTTSNGGALYVGTGAVVTVNNVLFKGNFANGGGAIALANGNLTVENSEISYNSANYDGSGSKKGGGGFYATSGTAVFRNTLFAKNNVDSDANWLNYQGSAMLVAGSANLTVENSTVFGNYQGAISLFSGAGQKVFINSTIIGNGRNSNDSAIFSPGGSYTLLNTIVASNHKDFGDNADSSTRLMQGVMTNAKN